MVSTHNDELSLSNSVIYSGVLYHVVRVVMEHAA